MQKKKVFLYLSNQRKRPRGTKSTLFSPPFFLQGGQTQRCLGSSHKLFFLCAFPPPLQISIQFHLLFSRLKISKLKKNKYIPPTPRFSLYSSPLSVSLTFHLPSQSPLELTRPSSPTPTSTKLSSKIKQSTKHFQKHTKKHFQSPPSNSSPISCVCTEKHIHGTSLSLALISENKDECKSAAYPPFHPVIPTH